MSASPDLTTANPGAIPAPVTDNTPPIPARRQYLIILVLGLGSFMAALDLMIVAPAFPTLQRDFGVSERAVAWVIGIYALFNVLSLPTMAKLADRYGRRRIYLLDVALFAVGSLIAVLSPSFGVLLLARAVQAAGAGGIFPTVNAIVGDTFRKERRGLAYGITGSLWGMAAVIGPNLGGFLTQHFSWHWLFIINLPLAVIVFIGGARVLPEGGQARTGTLDVRGLVLGSLALVGLMGALNEVDGGKLPGSLVTLPVLGSLAVFAVFGALFVWAERRAASPVIPLSLFRHRDLRIADALGIVAGVVEASIVFMPTLAVIVLHFSTEESGYFLTPAALTLGFATPVVGLLLDRFGPRPVLTGGTLITALGLFLLGTVVDNTATFFLALVIGGLGLSSLLGTPLRYLTANAAAPEERATSMAVLSISTNVGIALGSALFGALAVSVPGHPVTSIHHAYLALAGVAFAAVGIASLIHRRTPEEATAALAAAAEKRERRRARRARRSNTQSLSSSGGE